MAKKHSKRNPWIRLAFLLYCATMLWLLFHRDRQAVSQDYWGQVQNSLNLIPFHTVKLYMNLLEHSASEYYLRQAFINLAGNVLLFIPFGYFLPAIWQKMRRFLPFLLVSLGTICTVEICQMLLLVGSCDVDDLILNMLGITAGFLVYRIFRKKKE